MKTDIQLSDDLPVSEMIRWIAYKYQMSKADLSRMFQTTQSTIHYWLKTNKVSYNNLKKVRASYYYLHNTTDPHVGERKCEDCLKWHPIDQFRNGKAICRGCENKKTLKHYWDNREEELKRRKAKNWYNKKAN